MKTYKHYIIYKITNLINGYIYIGKHMCDKLDDGYFGSGTLLKKAIKEYGKENFVFHLEIDLHNKDEMDLLEEMVVNKEFLKRPDVYNMSLGGGKNPCLYGEKNPFYGKTFSEEQKRKISQRFKGKHISEIHKKRISEGLLLMNREHPENRKKYASLRGKCKCRDKNTGKIEFFKEDEIPENFEKYSRTKEKRQEWLKGKSKRKEKFSKYCSEKASKSKWYNNGKEESFCQPDKVPEGFVLGRLPTTNVGRKLSEETKMKIRLKHLGSKAPNEGKIFITNGIENRYITKDEQIPDGWKRGLTRGIKNP